MSIVLVGKNSFLTQNLSAHASNEELISLSHDEIDNNKPALKRASCVINFSFNPALRCAPYESKHDIDSLLASHIGKDTHYIMISSRMVYGEGSGGLPVFFEESECFPQSDYGRNKFLIERKLADALGDRLTILRLSNIFGFEPGRPTFMGRILDSLKQSGTIKFDIAPDSKRDFLPLSAFQASIGKILSAPAAGIYNIGSGIGLSPEEISGWVIEGYGQGAVEYKDTSHKGQFVLDIHKAAETFSIPAIKKEDLKAACIECGQRLRYL